MCWYLYGESSLLNSIISRLQRISLALPETARSSLVKKNYAQTTPKLLAQMGTLELNQTMRGNYNKRSKSAYYSLVGAQESITVQSVIFEDAAYKIQVHVYEQESYFNYMPKWTKLNIYLEEFVLH